MSHLHIYGVGKGFSQHQFFSLDFCITDLAFTCITICTIIAYICITTFNDLSENEKKMKKEVIQNL